MGVPRVNVMSRVLYQAMLYIYNKPNIRRKRERSSGANNNAKDNFNTGRRETLRVTFILCWVFFFFFNQFNTVRSACELDFHQRYNLFAILTEKHFRKKKSLQLKEREKKKDDVHTREDYRNVRLRAIILHSRASL